MSAITVVVARITGVHQRGERSRHFMAIDRIIQELSTKPHGVWKCRHVFAWGQLDRDIVLECPRNCHCDNLFPTRLLQKCGCMCGRERVLRGMSRGSGHLEPHVVKAGLSANGEIWRSILRNGGQVLPDRLPRNLTKSVCEKRRNRIRKRIAQH